MASSPPPTYGNHQTPAKTPSHWSWALGILSSAKKQPRAPTVDSSTNDTGATNADLSHVTEESFEQQDSAAKSTGFQSTTSSLGDTFMSPVSRSSDRLSTAGEQTSSRRLNGISSPGGRRIPRLDFSALPSLTPRSQSKANGATSDSQSQLFATGDRTNFRNSKSPWHSHTGAKQNTTTPLTAPSPWNTRRNQADDSTRPLSLVTTASSARTRRYRPNAVGLVGSRPVGRRYRRAGKLEPDRLSQALVSLKNSYTGMIDECSSTKITAAKGKVQWGSFSRPSRLPRPSQKRQRSEQRMQPENEKEEEYGSRKKRKKVAFDEEGDDGDQAVITRISAAQFAATPAGKLKSVAHRKGTPMPPRQPTNANESPFASAQSFNEEGGMDEDTPSSDTPSSKGPESLPEMPRTIDFKPGQPLEFTAKVESFDTPTLDPELNAKAFDWVPAEVITTKATPSIQDRVEWDSLRFEKPKSPPKKTPPTVSSNDDESGTQEQATKRSKTSGPTAGEEQQPDWECSKCGRKNKSDDSKCTGCAAYRGDGIKPDASAWGGTFKHLTTNKWRCRVCAVFNDNNVSVCKSCNNPKNKEGKDGGAEPTGTPAPNGSATGSQTVSTFGATDNKPSKFVFGAATGTLPVPTGQPQEPSRFVFSAPTSSSSSMAASSTGGFSFGSTPAPVQGTASFGAFTFGQSKTDKKEKEEKREDFTPGEAKAAGTASNSDGNKTSTGPVNTTATGSAGPTEDAKGKVEKNSSAPTMSAGFRFPTSGENGDKKPFESEPSFASRASSSYEQVDTGGSSLSISTPQHLADQKADGKFPENSFGSFPGGQPSAKRSRGYNLEESKAPAPGPAPPLFGQQDKTSTPALAPTAFPTGGLFTPVPAANSAPAPGTPGFSFASAPAPTGSDKNVSWPNNQSFGFSASSIADAGVSEPKGQSEHDPRTFGSKASAVQGASFGAPSTAPSATSANVNFGSTTAIPASGDAFGSSRTSFASTNSYTASAPFSNTSSTPGPAASGRLDSTAALAPYEDSSSMPAAAQFEGSSSTSTPAQFGGSSSTPAPGQFGGSSFTPAPAFGSSSSTPAPAPFGSSSSTPAPAPFGSSSTPVPALFGSTAAPATTFQQHTNFGISAPAPSSNASTGGVGGPQTASTPAPFGAAPSAAPSVAGFSASAPGSMNLGSAPGAAMPGASSFGSTSNTQSSGFAGFGSQTPVPTQGSSNALFSGGSTAANPTPSGGAPAGFGGFGSNTGALSGNSGAPNSGVSFGSGNPSGPLAPNGFGQAGGFGGFGGAQPSTGGFQHATPAASFQNPGGGPNTAPGGGGFSMGTSNPKPIRGRRMVRAKRPTRG